MNYQQDLVEPMFVIPESDLDILISPCEYIPEECVPDFLDNETADSMADIQNGRRERLDQLTALDTRSLTPELHFDIQAGIRHLTLLLSN
jgi:hypothetical protein